MPTDNIKKRYTEIFDQQPQIVVKSPGRINVIGEHTDYNEGFVLPTAIDKGVYVALGKRDDSKIELYAEDFKESFSTTLAEIKISEKGWPNYILGVIAQLQERNLEFSGFNLYIDGDIPVGAGLSSSAAVECATGFALNELFSLGLDRVEIAKIGQKAEHEFAGVKCGIMDQFASVLSKADSVLKLDCRTLEYEHVPLDLGKYEIILLNTNVKHSLASSAYNDRRQSCEQAVEWIKKEYPEVNSLRDVNEEMLKSIVLPRNEDTYIKSKYVIDENNRLLKACEALSGGNIEKLGTLLFQAHWALSKEYEVSCPELDFLVDYAEKHNEILGARMMGGGFGGCTINLIEKGKANSIFDELAPIYKEKFGLDLSLIEVKIEGGTQVLWKLM